MGVDEADEAGELEHLGAGDWEPRDVHGWYPSDPSGHVFACNVATR